MPSTQRREFLKALAAAIAAGTIPAPIGQALALPANRRAGSIMDVEHVVILMQENRSFDHYYGTLRGVRGFGDPRPLMLRSGKSVFHQPTPDGIGEVLPFHLDSKASNAPGMKSLDHSWKGPFAEWANYDVWIKHKTALTMGHFRRDDIPFYHALADAFTIGDNYFCSLHGPTNPNRMYLFSGTSGLSVGDERAQVVHNVDDGNWTADMTRDKADYAAMGWTTYAERLQAAGLDWRVYQEWENYGDNSLAYFKQFRGLDPASELYRRARAYAPGSSSETAKTSEAQYLVGAFAADVRADRLPQVSWIVAPYKYTEHPEATPAHGESLVSRLIAALVANPAVWAKTVFIINYDENDGFFDHIPGPVPAIDRAQGLSTVDVAGESYEGAPVGLGIRVPLLVVSPWTRGGWVNSEVFDHTSVIRFLERRFGVTEPNITPWRRSVTGDLTSMFDFADPDRSALHSLPSVEDNLRRTAAAATLPPPAVPARQAMPVQDTGQRPARPLPYQLSVRDVRQADGSWALEFTNTGSLGAAFAVHDRAGTAGPWTYTVSPGTRLIDRPPGLAAGAYRLVVQGPNGFLRELAGNDPTPLVALEEAGNAVILKLANPTDRPSRLTVRALAYDRAEPVTIVLKPGETRTVRRHIAGSHHWYDLLVSGEDGFSRRFAGHVETGRPSWSDPAMGTLVTA